MGRSVCQDVKVLKLAPFGQTGGEAGLWELALELPSWEEWFPGQFVMIRPANWGLEPLWARPFSICRVEEDSLRLFIQVVGPGTAKLAALSQGDTVTVWGPLGNGFAMEPDTPTLLLAGGIGIAPFVGYILGHPNPANVFLFFGHTRPLASFPFEFLQGLVSSRNFYQAQPEQLDECIGQMRAEMERFKDGLILACGPTPFLRTVRRHAMELGVADRTQLSLENRMACGIGACLGCVCKTSAGTYRKVCAEGPMFWAKDIFLEDD